MIKQQGPFCRLHPPQLDGHSFHSIMRSFSSLLLKSRVFLLYQKLEKISLARLDLWSRKVTLLSAEDNSPHI